MAEIKGIPAYDLGLTGDEVKESLTKVKANEFLAAENGAGANLTLITEANSDSALLKKSTIKGYFSNYIKFPSSGSDRVNKTITFGWDDGTAINYISRDGLSSKNSLLFVQDRSLIGQVTNPTNASSATLPFVLKWNNGPIWVSEPNIVIDDSGVGNVITDISESYADNVHSLTISRAEMCTSVDKDNLQADIDSKINLSLYQQKGDIAYALGANSPTVLSMSEADAGRVLTANENGLPSWQELPSFTMEEQPQVTTDVVLSNIALDDSDNHKILVTKTTVIPAATYYTKVAEIETELSKKATETEVTILSADAIHKSETFNSTGSILYAADANLPADLPIGEVGKVLKVSSNRLPQWADEKPITITSSGNGNAVTNISRDTDSHTIIMTKSQTFATRDQIGDKLSLSFDAATGTLNIVKTAIN